jgi:hypothetical protein
MSKRRFAALAVVVLFGAAVVAAAAWTQGRDEEQERSGLLDLSRARGRDAPFLSVFDYSALYIGASVDRIPAIDEPRLETPAEASSLLRPESLVIGIERNGEAHAYPTNLLSLHEVVNDVVGGEPVVVSWCPLCSSALAYERRVGGRVLTFGVSGYLYHANLMLFDRRTGSLWSQLLGGAVTGHYRGTRLRPVPIVHETWAAWRRAHPGTRVLSIRRDEFARRFIDPGVEESIYGEEPSDAPYLSYATKVPYLFRRTARGLQEATRVYGVVIAGRAAAYPLGVLRRRGVVRDLVAGVPVVVRYDDEAFSAVAFARGKRLPGTFAYWFAWRHAYPKTTVYDDARRH